MLHRTRIGSTAWSFAVLVAVAVTSSTHLQISGGSEADHPKKLLLCVDHGASDAAALERGIQNQVPDLHTRQVDVGTPTGQSDDISAVEVIGPPSSVAKAQRVWCHWVHDPEPRCNFKDVELSPRQKDVWFENTFWPPPFSWDRKTVDHSGRVSFRSAAST